MPLSTEFLHISSWLEWQSAMEKCKHANNPYLLLSHPGVSLGERDLELMRSALTGLPEDSAVIARVFDRKRPNLIVNAGYWQDHDSLRWNMLSMAEIWADSDKPLLADANQVSLGAVLISRKNAQRVGFFDPRFASQLSDLEWLIRASNNNINCVVVRNARAVAENMDYAQNMSDLYGTTRDGLLLERLKNKRWPIYLCRVLYRLLVEVWRPFDFHMEKNLNHSFPRRWLWAVSSYRNGLRQRMSSRESMALLTAVRDFLLCRYHRDVGG